MSRPLCLRTCNGYSCDEWITSGVVPVPTCQVLENNMQCSCDGCTLCSDSNAPPIPSSTTSTTYSYSPPAWVQINPTRPTYYPVSSDISNSDSSLLTVTLSIAAVFFVATAIIIIVVYRRRQARLRALANTGTPRVVTEIEMEEAQMLPYVARVEEDNSERNTHAYPVAETLRVVSNGRHSRSNSVTSARSSPDHHILLRSDSVRSINADEVGADIDNIPIAMTTVQHSFTNNNSRRRSLSCSSNSSCSSRSTIDSELSLGINDGPVADASRQPSSVSVLASQPPHQQQVLPVSSSIHLSNSIAPAVPDFHYDGRTLPTDSDSSGHVVHIEAAGHEEGFRDVEYENMLLARALSLSMQDNEAPNLENDVHAGGNNGNSIGSFVSPSAVRDESDSDQTANLASDSDDSVGSADK